MASTKKCRLINQHKFVGIHTGKSCGKSQGKTNRFYFVSVCAFGKTLASHLIEVRFTIQEEYSGNFSTDCSIEFDCYSAY